MIFKKILRPCTLDESSLSIERVKEKEAENKHLSHGTNKSSLILGYPHARLRRVRLIARSLTRKDVPLCVCIGTDAWSALANTA